ncbi:MAG TPA: Rrf2 family transcriptional regulator [Stenotrophobium sp.]|nr:Rrf2 family transcriptional regulator [Stenotrophobium sp.]
MQLTRFTDYALRVLMFVGRHRDRDHICTIREIAGHHRISLEHLRKVIHKLAKLGYLETSRGRGGGIMLGRDVAEIRLGEVILAMEEDMSIVDCQALECILQPACSLKAALDRGGRAFIAELDRVTLADLLGDRKMKRQFRIVDGADRQ